MQKQLHVLIVGGGLGGLALAQGLKKHGISCAVYEKDLSRADRLQGYRIVLHVTSTILLMADTPRLWHRRVEGLSSTRLVPNHGPNVEH